MSLTGELYKVSKYLREVWSHGVFGILRIVLTALRGGGTVDLRIVDGLIKEIERKTMKSIERIAADRYFQIASSAEPNLAPLRALLAERQDYVSSTLAGYRFAIKKFDNPALKIGRRGQDIIREMSLETLEEGFLRGNPTALTAESLVEKIVKKGTLFDSFESAAEAIEKTRIDVVRKIPLFHEDGEAKFLLQVKTKGQYRGAFRRFSVASYADLVAVTTAGEADGAGHMAQAAEIGTRIVKWNSTGKGKAFYRSIGDDRCANVDGEFASLEPEGTTINGTYYPYIHSDERLPGRYLTCHPYCRHGFRAYPEEAL